MAVVREEDGDEVVVGGAGGALVAVVDAERCDEPHAAQASSTHAAIVARLPGLEIRDHGGNRQSLAELPPASPGPAADAPYPTVVCATSS